MTQCLGLLQSHALPMLCRYGYYTSLRYDATMLPGANLFHLIDCISELVGKLNDKSPQSLIVTTSD